nr:unnamed protein product [Digitaria exilis]
MGRRRRFAFRRAVMPNASVMSNSAGSARPGTSQSKWNSRLASASSTLASPNAIPGHILRPAPNGRSSKSAPFKSTSTPPASASNRSGRNASGSPGQYRSSRPSAHAFTSTVAPRGTSYPSTRHASSRDSRGSSSGSGVCSRSVSRITRCRYRSSPRACSGTVPSVPKASRTSAVARRMALGFRMSSARAHSSVVADVSLPAPKMSCRRKRCLITGHQHLTKMTALSTSMSRGIWRLPSFCILSSTWRRSSFSPARPLDLHQVLLDDAIKDPVHRVAAPLGAPHGAAEPSDEPRRRPQVRRVEPCHELDGASELPQEHVTVLAPVAHHDSRRGVGDQRGQPRAHLDDAAGARRGRGARAQQRGDLLLADGAEREDAARAEELGDGDLAEVAPVVTVGREDDATGAVAEHGHGGAQRPRRERDVVRLHHLARRLTGRDHQRGHLADPEQHHRPVATGQVTHGAVRELAGDVVHAADDRQLPGPRGETQAMAVGPPALGDHHQQRHESQGEV